MTVLCSVSIIHADAQIVFVGVPHPVFKTPSSLFLRSLSLSYTHTHTYRYSCWCGWFIPDPTNNPLFTLTLWCDLNLKETLAGDELLIQTTFALYKNCVPFIYWLWVRLNDTSKCFLFLRKCWWHLWVNQSNSSHGHPVCCFTAEL